MDLISILLSSLHIISALLLVVGILLQSGKGGGLAGLGGGSTAAATQMFGGGGAGNFLSRSTVGLASIFMATSLALAYVAAKPNSAMDLGETSGGVASQEDPILEEGTGPLDFLNDAKKKDPTPNLVKPNLIKLPDAEKTLKLEIPKEDSAVEKDLKKSIEEATIKDDAKIKLEKMVKEVKAKTEEKVPAKKPVLEKTLEKAVDAVKKEESK